MNKKKKILIRIGSLRHGGAEKVLVTFLKNLSSEKYEIDLLLNLYCGKYLRDVPSWINIYYLNKGEIITTNRPKDIPIKAFRVISEAIIKKFPKLLYNYILPDKKYDIEFAAIHGIADEILSSPNKASKKIVWIHNDLSKIPEYTEERLKSFFKFDKILVISEKIHQLFLGLSSSEEDKNKIIRIFNPIDTNEIIELSNEKVEHSIDIDPSLRTFISVGTKLKQKGYDRLVKIHKNLLNKGFKHQILIVGENSEKLKQEIKELKVEKTFILLGYQSNPYPFFKLADYYVLSSRYEGYPTVLFEALLLNKFVLTTEVSGVSDMISNNENGIIVENSEVSLQKGMEDLLNSESIRTVNNQVPYTLSEAVYSIEKILTEK